MRVLEFSLEVMDLFGLVGFRLGRIEVGKVFEEVRL